MHHHFNENSFWMVVKRYASAASFISDALALYYCMIDEATPATAKTAIAVALAYLVVPTDAIADWIPVYGLIDDASVIAVTLSIVQGQVTEEHRRRAQEWLAL